MAGKLSGNAIVDGSITTTQLASDVSDVIAQGGGPKVLSIAYANNALAADNTGNSVVIVTGTGFNPGVTVYVNGVVSSTVTRALELFLQTLMFLLHHCLHIILEI